MRIDCSPERKMRDEAMVSQYQSGDSALVVAKRHGVTPPIVYIALRRAGVPSRTMSEIKRRHTVNVKAFDSDSDECAYWIGFLLADGCVYSTDHGDSHNVVALQLAVKDRDHVCQFRNFVGASSPILEIESKGSCRVQVYSETLIRSLVRRGVTPRKSDTAKAPDDLADSVSFWRGVVDGDGCLSWKNGHGSPQPVLNLVGTEAVCRGLISFVVKRFPEFSSNPRRKSGEFLWTVSWVSQRARQIAELLYSEPGPCLQRKKTIAEEFSSRCQPYPFMAWDKVTRDGLLAMKDRLGSWGAVASSLGINYQALMIQKTKRYGIRR